MIKRIKRPKALFGIGNAAIAAAIYANTAATVASQTASAIMQRNAILDQAGAQARAMKTNADIQAKSIQNQTSNNNKLQRQLIDIQKQQANQQKQYYDTMNANMALLAGNNNARQEREQAKIVAKRGGKARPKLRNARISSPVGKYYDDGFNMPFEVTDGGYARLLGYTPEGFAVYETIGDNHEHSHKYGNKRATGVGYKFANGAVVEGEGNQNSSTGELMVTTPNDAWFLSKHSIKGFNPTEQVFSGMHPLQAAAIQESLKRTNNNSTKAKCGKRVKGWDGLDTFNAIGGGVSILGNLLGAGIINIANNRAAGILNDASQEAANTLVTGYRKLRGIDPSIIQDQAFNAPTVMAATTNSSANFNPEREALATATRESLKTARRSTLSSAVRNNLASQILSKAVAERNNIAAQEARINMQNAENNANRIQDASKTQATLALQANENRNNLAYRLAEYNNDIANYAIQGEADALAGNIQQRAQNLANARIANAQTWGNAINSITGTVNNFTNSYVTNERNKQIAMMTATKEGLEAYNKAFGKNSTKKNIGEKYKLNIPDIQSKASPITAPTIKEVQVIPNNLFESRNDVGNFIYDPNTGGYKFDFSKIKRRLGGNIRYSLKRR